MQNTCVLLLATSALALGQEQPGPRPVAVNQGGPGPAPFRMEGPRPQLFGGPGGKWWANPAMVKRLEITPDQQKKMDDVLQQSRLRLIDLKATLEKEEVMMEGLMRGSQLDDAKILPAVDRIAQARAELEKANARMMLGIRHVLTPEQWEKLNAPMHFEGPRPGQNQRPANGPNGPNGPPPGTPREE